MDLMTLIRVYLQDRTLGSWYWGDRLICKTLELPWLNNKRGISCIPEDIYDVIKEPPKETRPYRYFRLPDVPGRSGILAHRGVIPAHSRGCILVGSRFKDITTDFPSLEESGKKLEWMADNFPDKFRLMIRAKISTILVLLILCGCGPTSKLKRAEKLIKQAIEKGAKVDSTNLITYDTVKINAFRDGFRIVAEVNPEFLVEKCKELTEKPQGRPQIITQIQREICPQVSTDTTYTLNVEGPGGLYKVPLRVVINAQGGALDFSIAGKEVIVPVRTQTSQIEISSGYTLWQLIILAIICLLVGIAVGKIFLK